MRILHIEKDYAIVQGKSKKTGGIIPVAIPTSELAYPVTYKGNEYKKEEISFCSDCGDFIPAGNKVVIQGMVLCSGCSWNYIPCTKCGEIHNKKVDMEFVDGSYICHKCIEKDDSIQLCDSCGEFTHVDNLSKVDGRYICHECLHVIYRECIKEYHLSRSVQYYSTPYKSDTRRKTTKLYLGMELEMPFIGKDNGELAYSILKNPYLKIEKDTSIKDGFEVISDAMTLEVWQKEGFKSIGNAVSLAKKEGFKEHFSSGIHVHFHNEPFTPEQLKNIGAFVMLHYIDCIRFGRRDPLHLDFCESIDDTGSIMEDCRGHRMAVNFEHPLHTELRFFATSTDLNHIQAILEFVYCLCMTALRVNKLFEWEDLYQTAKSSGICPHFIKEYENNFNCKEIEGYDYTQVM